MGNSPRMVFKHYHELVAPKEAERYWRLTHEPALALQALAAPAKSAYNPRSRRAKYV